MSLNISKATATEFAFVIGHVPNGTNIHDTDALRLNVYNVNIPGLSLTDTEFLWQGKTVHYHIGGISFEPLTLNFTVDVNFENWKVLFNWMTFIADNKDIPSLDPDDYVTDASLILFDNFENVHSRIIFRNMWVQSLGEISFSIREGETQIESSATFYYDRYELSDG